MSTVSCIKERRSIRRFTKQNVSHELMAQIVETASYSPSWKNTQVVRYICVEGSLKDTIATECTSSFPSNSAIITGAPMLVVIAVLKNRCGYERDGSFSTSRKDSWQMFDAGIASQSFCLAAHVAGIGSVVLGIFDEIKVSSLLELPDTMETVALIPVGYPDETPVAPKRKTVDELLSFK